MKYDAKCPHCGGTFSTDTTTNPIGDLVTCGLDACPQPETEWEITATMVKGETNND